MLRAGRNDIEEKTPFRFGPDYNLEWEAADIHTESGARRSPAGSEVRSSFEFFAA